MKIDRDIDLGLSAICFASGATIISFPYKLGWIGDIVGGFLFIVGIYFFGHYFIIKRKS